MGTIDTYLKEYGNYTFQEEEFNEVDAIIFSLLSYANLLDIVPESKKEKILLKDAALLFSKKYTSAIEHLFKVASGLDSIVLGEDQILGQVKDAHDFSMQLGSSKKIFNKLFREAVNIAKDIKNTTKISHQPLSISYIGIKFLQNKVGNLEGKKALVIGIGKMNRLTMKYLEEEKLDTIYVSNRYDFDQLITASYLCRGTRIRTWDPLLPKQVR